MYLIGRIADQTDTANAQGNFGPNGLVEINGALNLPKGVNAFKDSIAINHGGVGSDYDVFDLTSTGDQDRINTGASFVTVWAVDEIVGVDFALEDAKLIVDFISDKDMIIGNGTSVATITVTAYDNDGITVATQINSNQVIPIEKGNEIVNTLVRFTNGVAALILKDTKGGEWVFPTGTRILNGNVRVRAYADVSVLEDLS